MKKHLSTILLLLMFLVGLSVLSYPAISNYWNSKVQSRVIVDYANTLQHMEKKDYSQAFAAAHDYNDRLQTIPVPMNNPEAEVGYAETLDISGSGAMGYIDIDKIGVELPIYHGTSPAVLNSAVGHVIGSSLPVGGDSCHTVLSAHRGLPSARLFTDLDKMEVGDSFTITILDRVLLYEVDQVLIVRPDEMEYLDIQPGEDFCTLLTCTPYGINTHRLLVRGTRVDSYTAKAALFIPNEAFRIDPIVVTPVVAAPMLLAALVVLLVKYRKK